MSPTLAIASTPKATPSPMPIFSLEVRPEVSSSPNPLDPVGEEVAEEVGELRDPLAWGDVVGAELLGLVELKDIVFNLVAPIAEASPSSKYVKVTGYTEL